MDLKNKVAIIAVLLLVAVNPLVAVHINTGIDWVFTQIVMYSGYVMLVCLAYLVVLYVLSYRKTYKLNVPSKSAKTSKAGKFLTT